MEAGQEFRFVSSASDVDADEEEDLRSRRGSQKKDDVCHLDEDLRWQYGGPENSGVRLLPRKKSQGGKAATGGKMEPTY